MGHGVRPRQGRRGTGPRFVGRCTAWPATRFPPPFLCPADLSYAWTVLYGGGLAFMGAYLVLARAAVGAAFNFVELGLVALTLGGGWR